MSSKKILFIAHHRLDRSPGQRYRFEQVFDYLESKGLECVLANIIAEEDEYSLYQSNNIIRKLWIGIKSYKKRFQDLLNSVKDQYYQLYNSLIEKHEKNSTTPKAH